MNDDYKACLREHGLKSTKARNGVLDILSRETSVVTVETVYAALLEQDVKSIFPQCTASWKCLQNVN